ncbi:MAG: hypothetical protein IK069_04205, partial [Firmicutes bacterium]|nr:hypothetical protein [Bacillota bacterium]
VHESTVNNNRKCVIIGDSFRHSLAPFLAKDFRKVTVAHRGDFNTISKSKKTDNGSVVNCGRPIIQDALSELKSGDVLIVMAVERYDFANVSMAETITGFMRNLP